MSLITMLADDNVTITEIGAWLDSCLPQARKDAVFGLDRRHQRKLYERASDGPAITSAHFVPDGRDPLTEVIHHGRNTLPLPASHRVFQKRFCRSPEDATRIFGYNEARSRSLIGPGYFVAYETASRSEWKPRGGVVVDYFDVPDGPVVPDWPTVVPNSRGLQVLVYHKTRDFMRRVSQHVSIGAAYKKERGLGQFFVLVRDD